MKRESALSMVFLIILVSWSSAFKVQRVQASGTIYIRADGSVDPSTAPIQREGNVYTLTGNIISDTDGIIVERDDIMLDGSGYTVQGTAGGSGVGLSWRSNVTIKNMEIKAFYDGINMWHSLNNIISENGIKNNTNGISIWDSSDNNVSGNNIENSWISFDLKRSSNNRISVNNITNNGEGILLDSSSDNDINGNDITENNGDGIRLTFSSNKNRIHGNRITRDKCGLRISTSSNNFIYHNNIMDNIEQVDVEGSMNIWDDGLEGNFWSNYIGVDSDFDGIGESWYEIHEFAPNDYDRYPLMGIFHSFNTSLGYDVNVISNSTIEDFRYFDSNGTIKMYVSNVSANQTYGFCRISIPHVLMSEPYNVTIDGAEPYYVNYTLHDNENNRWIYFSYQHSTLEVTIIPELPSLLILPLFFIATLLAVIIYGRRHAQREWIHQGRSSIIIYKPV